MAFADEINYEKISTINKKERKSAKLITLDPGFYDVLIEHLKKLQEEYNTKFLESPTSTEALLLNNEICKLDNMIKEIYTRRERKIILSALDTNSSPNFRQMLDHEQELYKSITQILSEYRAGILEQKPLPKCATVTKSDQDVGENQSKQSIRDIQVTSEETTKPSVEPFDSNISEVQGSKENNEMKPKDVDEPELEFEPNLEQDLDHEPESEQKQENESESEPELVQDQERGLHQELEHEKRLDKEPPQDQTDIGEQEEGEEHILVHVLEEIEPFVGTDLVTYTLQKEELATIPKSMAELLMKNNKVRIVETDL